jgi:hypothetical protein
MLFSSTPFTFDAETGAVRGMTGYSGEGITLTYHELIVPGSAGLLCLMPGMGLAMVRRRR